jgi:hypothetical protein
MKKSSRKVDVKKTTRTPRITTMSRVDFDYCLNLPEEKAKELGLELDNITKVEDLAFLKDKKELWDLINLTSNDQIISQLLFMNKVQTNKTFVELTLFNTLKYEEKELFMKEILENVTEHNYLFLNETDFNLKSDLRISFTLKFGKRNKVFHLCNSQGEKPDKPDFFTNLSIDFSLFDYLLIDLIEFMSFGDSTLEVISKFANYIKEKILPNKQLKIILSFPDIIKNFSNLNLDTLNLIESLFSFSDIMIFEKSEANAIFNMFHQINNTTEEEEKTIEAYFKKLQFARHGNKTVLIFDDFQKLQIFTICPKKKQHMKNELDFTLYPKINHTNQKLIEDYKKIITVYHSQLKSYFFGGFLARVLSGFSNFSMEFYAGFLVGSESVKRVVELIKNNVELPNDSNFYLVKLPKTKIKKEIEKENLKKKEDKFVLDCINKKSSHLKHYNPLFDDHLNSYFASESIRRQLKNKGFINTNGFILWDPAYKTIMASSSPHRRKSNDKEKEKQLLYALKNHNISEDSQDKSFDYSKIQKSNSPTERKLPAFQFEYAANNKTSNLKYLKKKLEPLKKPGKFFYYI